MFEFVLVFFQLLDNSFDLFILVLEVFKGFLNEGWNFQHLFGVISEVDSEGSFILKAEGLDLMSSVFLDFFYSVLESVSFFHNFR
jgi:hypothetical protein